MSEWKLKRFWTEVQVEKAGGGYSVRLDGRSIRTPGKAPLDLPTRALAESMAAEWQAQSEEVRPETMPITRFANSAIDRVAPQFEEVAAIVSAFGETDLLCYRAEGPAELQARQAAAWDPVLDWAERTFSGRMNVTSGVIPVSQPQVVLDALGNAVRSRSAFELAALHELVSLTGSLVLGLAADAGELTPDEAWAHSRIDEIWQIEQWGPDEEAEEVAARRTSAFADAMRFLVLTRRA